MKTVKLQHILTPDEIARAIQICEYASYHSDGNAVLGITNELILPNIERINKKTGQENDPRYLAYAVEFALRSNDPRAPKSAPLDPNNFDCGDPTICE
jgi:hypothetical protein